MLTYLASPYSPKGETNPEKANEIREHRFKMISMVAGRLMEQGYHIFCPIAHSHPIEIYGLPKIMDGDWWLKQDFEIIQHCGLVLVCTMSGWDKSYGIGKELEFAKKRNIPIKYVNIQGVITDEPVSTVYSPEPLREVLGRQAA